MFIISIWNVVDVIVIYEIYVFLFTNGPFQDPNKKMAHLTFLSDNLSMTNYNDLYLSLMTLLATRCQDIHDTRYSSQTL